MLCDIIVFACELGVNVYVFLTMFWEPLTCMETAFALASMEWFPDYPDYTRFTTSDSFDLPDLYLDYFRELALFFRRSFRSISE